MQTPTVILFKYLSTAALILFAPLCVAADKNTAMAACASAEAARSDAAQVSMEWTTTSGLIKAGNKALESGDFNQAMTLCQKAKFQGDTAVAQAAREASAWRARVPQ